MDSENAVWLWRTNAGSYWHTKVRLYFGFVSVTRGVSMIARVLQLLCLAATSLTLGAVIAWGICKALGQQITALQFRRLAFVSLVTAVISIAVATRYAQSFTRRVESLPFGVSKDTVRQVLGSPTQRIEPAIGLGGKPDTNTAIWCYRIGVWPLSREHCLEFAHDKLLSR